MRKGIIILCVMITMLLFGCEEEIIPSTSAKPDVVQNEAAKPIDKANPALLKQQRDILEIIDSIRVPASQTLMVSLYDFETGQKISYQAEKELHPASVIKTLFMLTFLDDVQNNNRSLEDGYMITEQDKYGSPGSLVGGSGILQGAKIGSKYSWGELMSLMISISDNVATNLFMENLGLDTINSKAKAYGLKNTLLVRKLYQKIPGNNHTTTDDMNQVLVALQSKQIIDGKQYDYALKTMKETINKGRIGRYIPDDIIIANKTGTLEFVVGDSALLFFPNREPLALTIFLDGNNGSRVPLAAAEETIGDLAQKIVEYFYQ